MKKKIVGISSDFKYIEDIAEEGYKRYCLNEDYSQAIEKSGGIPIIIPISQDIILLEETLNLCDCLLLSGGSDVDSFLYNEERRQKLLNIKPLRDSYEKTLYYLAKKKQIPILGICRGMQLINVLAGGTLYQDLSYRSNSTLQHSQKDSRSSPSHYVTLTKYSFLKNIFKNDRIAVNSYHHQCIKDLAPIFNEIAISSDGIIEAFENKDKNIIGIQWHPEKMFTNKEMMNIFKFFLSL